MSRISKLLEQKDKIEIGDYVDFGAKGKLYVCSSSRVTDEEEDRFNPNARGWGMTIPEYGDVIQKGSEVDKDSYEQD